MPDALLTAAVVLAAWLAGGLLIGVPLGRHIARREREPW